MDPHVMFRVMLKINCCNFKVTQVMASNMLMPRNKVQSSDSSSSSNASNVINQMPQSEETHIKGMKPVLDNQSSTLPFGTVIFSSGALSNNGGLGIGNVNEPQQCRYNNECTNSANMVIHPTIICPSFSSPINCNYGVLPQNEALVYSPTLSAAHAVPSGYFPANLASPSSSLQPDQSSSEYLPFLISPSTNWDQNHFYIATESNTNSIQSPFLEEYNGSLMSYVCPQLSPEIISYTCRPWSRAPTPDEVSSEYLASVTMRLKKRRESHNAVERRRRININERIQILSSVVPECKRRQTIKANTIRGTNHGKQNSHQLNKAFILQKTTEYIEALSTYIEKQSLIIRKHNPLYTGGLDELHSILLRSNNIEHIDDTIQVGRNNPRITNPQNNKSPQTLGNTTENSIFTSNTEK